MSGQKIQNFKNLQIWQLGIQIVKNVYALTKHFPSEEKFTLCYQCHRAAISITSNIAEGFKRRHNKEFVQFLNIASGSAAELETQLIIANELNYIDITQSSSIIEQIEQLNKMTHALIQKL